MQSGSAPHVDDPFADLKLPSIEEQTLQLQKLVEQGVLSPEQAQAELAGRSEMDNVSTDPNLHKAQMDALSGLQDVANNGGLTDADKANLNKIKTDEDTSARGKREAILQNANSRGLGGSGLELLSQMTNQQDSATRQSQRDMDVAGTAQQRALDALIQSGTAAGNIQNQDFNQQAQKASANDAISKFNAANKQNVNLANVNANNTAQAANLANKQGVANTNVNLANQQQQANKQLIQQQFDNEMKKRSGTAGVNQANAAADAQNSQNRANAFNQTVGMGIGAGSTLLSGALKPAAAAKAASVGPMAGAPYSQYTYAKDGGMVMGEPTDYDSQPHMLQPGEFVVKKDDVPDFLAKAHTDEHGKFDAAGFLDSITGHKYSYKKGKK